jgi:hypothetical protein
MISLPAPSQEFNRTPYFFWEGADLILRLDYEGDGGAYLDYDIRFFGAVFYRFLSEELCQPSDIEAYDKVRSRSTLGAHNVIFPTAIPVLEKMLMYDSYFDGLGSYQVIARDVLVPSVRHID